MQVNTPPRQEMFDSRQQKIQRDRAVRLGFVDKGAFLHQHVAEQIGERVADVTRPFTRAIVIGSGGGVHARALAGRAAKIQQIELSSSMAKAAGAEHVDDIDTLALDQHQADLVISALEMHALNDPVGHLIQMRRALKPDGLMIAALFGGETLNELRASFAEAEVKTVGGLSPRVAPMAEVRDLGGLLQRAGFAMPVADVERYTVAYKSAQDLMHDLRLMGETNIQTARRRETLRRDTLAAVEQIYASNFPSESGGITATFDVVFLTGWSPAAGQPQPLRPGTAKARLADALGSTEQSTGETAGFRNSSED